MSALGYQTERDGILRELARATYAKAHAGAECPPDFIPRWEVIDSAPTLAALKRPALIPWLSECPQEDRDAADALLAEVFAVRAIWTHYSEPRTLQTVHALIFGDVEPKEGISAVALMTSGGEVQPASDATMEAVHAAWAAKAVRPRHPLAPIVAAWQHHTPVSSDWDTRQHANLPGPLTRTRHVVAARDLADEDSKARLPFDWDAYATPAPPDAPRFEVGYLPTLEPGPSVLPLALLDTFTGGAGRGRGGPVPVPERLLWETILAVPPANRAHAAELRATLGALARKVWPASRWDESKHGPALLRALDYLDTRAIRWRADGQDHDGVRVFTVWRLPQETAFDTEVTLIASLPPVGSHQGPQVDRLALRTLAARSARQHRAMACAACLWDAYATIKGRMVAPTLPVVERNPAGYVLDTRGRVVSEHGAPTRRATHRNAVQTGAREPNPEADRYPWLDDRDLLLLCHLEIASTPAGIREQRHRTIKTLTALRDNGLLYFEARYRSVRGGRELEAVRLLPSVAHVEAHAARWAARKHNRAGA